MKPPSLAIADILSHGRPVRIEDRILVDRPNCVLRHFARKRPARRPRVLVVAPMSGHFGWIMRDTVIGLLVEHDVCLLEWKDARDIPAQAGRLGLDAAIAEVMAALRRLGPGVAVLGVSQAPTVILAAAALMAAQSEPERPRALVLMGGFIDPRRNPTAVEKMAARLPEGWFTRTMAVTLPADGEGGGRRVYPAAVHAHALRRYLTRHMATGAELYRKITADDGCDPERFPFFRLYSTLMDLPAEFAEENARKVFAEAHLARGQLTCQGRLVEPALMTDIALMTVEGGCDDSSAPGHTHAAHDLCSGLPANLRERWTDAAAGHFGLFHGEPWRSSILPRVVAFMARQGGCK